MKRNLLILLTLLMLLPVGASARSTGYACDHDWSEWHIYAPSCGYEGWKKRWCYNCNEEQTIYIPATGKHVWTKWETNREPDCLNTGEKDKIGEVAAKIGTSRINAIIKGIEFLEQRLDD